MSANKKDTYDSWTKLMVACEKGDETAVNQLLKNKEDIVDINKQDRDEMTPLHVACEEGHTNIVKLLLEHKATINWRHINCNTPLLLACQQGHIDIVRLLLEQNANSESSDEWKWTPLYSACYLGYTEIAQLLLDSNAVVDSLNGHGQTPLFAACEKGNTEIVKLLLDSNANIDFLNKLGQTPLFAACRHGQTEVVKLLIEYKANINLSGEKSWTPIKEALRLDRTEIVQLLQSKGAVTKKSKYYSESLFFPQKKESIDKDISSSNYDNSSSASDESSSYLTANNISWSNYSNSDDLSITSSSLDLLAGENLSSSSSSSLITIDLNSSTIQNNLEEIKKNQTKEPEKTDGTTINKNNLRRDQAIEITFFSLESSDSDDGCKEKYTPSNNTSTDAEIDDWVILDADTTDKNTKIKGKSPSSSKNTNTIVEKTNSEYLNDSKRQNFYNKDKKAIDAKYDKIVNRKLDKRYHERKSIVKSFTSNNHAKIIKLLDQYANGTNSVTNFFNPIIHPRRNHQEKIKSYLTAFSQNKGGDLADVVGKVAKLLEESQKPHSSLSRRMAYIENKLGYKKDLTNKQHNNIELLANDKNLKPLPNNQEVSKYAFSY